MSAADPAARAPSLDEVEAAFQAAPPEMVAEIIDGELSLLPRPRPRHARVSSRLGARLSPFDDPTDDEPGGWVILDEPELHLGARPDKLVPDLAGWRREQLPEVPDAAAIAVAPAWVCEVLSDRTERLDRGRKLRAYRRERVAHVWLASPEHQTLEVYRFEGDRYVLLETFEGDERVRAEPFDAIELDLAALWAR